MMKCVFSYILTMIPYIGICNVLDGGFPNRFSKCNLRNKEVQNRCILSELSSLESTDNAEERLNLRLRHDFYWHPKKRIRRECRALPKEEREALFSAINALKKDTSISPNAYDAFADIHTGKTIKSVHHGPNFFGWHKYYTLQFEELLRKVNPNVTLCYWDSRLDHVMGYPWGSVMFTDEFVGYYKGPIRTGPFAGWKTIRGIPLERDMGHGGSFILPNYTDNVLSQSSHVDITSTTAKSKNNLEAIHNAVHKFIGGQMDDLNTSTQDPLFWIHHAFVDSIWEKFCLKLRHNGIDPQDDYVLIKNKLHHPNQYMANFFPLRNIDGYSDYFQNNIYEYEDYASCPNCLNSPYLNCNEENLCYTVKKNDPRRNVSPNIIDTNHLSAPLNTITFISENMSRERWVFVPVKIVFRNAISKSIKYKNISGCQFADSHKDLCTKAVAILISRGITYYGTYTNYIVDDVSIPHWIYTYVGVRNPELGTSQALTIVTDKNGNLCHPHLLAENNNYNPFSGIISVSFEEPKIYLDSLEEAETSKFPFDPLQADSFDQRIKIKYFCY